MTTQVKSITLRAHYESDLGGRMKADAATIKSFRRQMESVPIRVPIRLDLSGLKSETAKAASEMRKAMSGAMAGGGGGGGSLSAGGIIIPASAAAQVKQFAKLTSGVFKTIDKDAGNVIRTFEQLDRGFQRITTARKTKEGYSHSTTDIDTRAVTNFQRKLDQIERDFAQRTGATKGNQGNVAALLAQKRSRIADVMSGTGVRGTAADKHAARQELDSIRETPQFRAAEKMLDRLDQRIAQNRGQQQRRAANDVRKDFNERSDRVISYRDNRVNRDMIKASKEQEAIARNIPDQTAREAALNRVLEARERLLQRQIEQYRSLQRITGENGHGEAENRFRNAGNRMQGQLNQVRLDRSREHHSGARSESDYELKKRLDAAIQADRTGRAELRVEERAAAAIPVKGARRTALEDIRSRRDALHGGTMAEIGSVGATARQRGNRGLADRATAAAGTVQRSAIADMNRLADATRNSGHAFDFHTNSLLKNVATFTKWYIPAQLAMKSFSAVGAGISGAIEAQRTFKILSVIYRGSAEDSAKLADGTLALAAANGRSAEEAAQAAVAWARLGMTKNQILVAMESSLQAANVAEISAAEATAYLTANYKAFGQTIADIPATLAYVNSLSNRNAVAPKQIFEGIARGGVSAKQAGLEFEQLAAIITTVSATTGRPGAEIGNAVKSMVSRLQKPKTMKDLKDQFGFDMTDGTGSAKKMFDVLNQLAALYPTLNTLEQGRLKNIVAGALQGNRFAVIMQTWNEALVAQTEAGTDANSTLNENAQILESVSSKLEKLSTTWTRLFHTMGEAGLFDWLGKAVDDAGLLVETLSRIGKNDKGSGGKESGGPLFDRLSLLEKYAVNIDVSSRRGANAFMGLDRASNLKRAWTIAKPTDEETRISVASLAARHSAIGESAQRRIEDNTGKNELSKNKLSAMAQKSGETRGTLKSMAAAAKFFENLGHSFGGKGSDKAKDLALFDRELDAMRVNKFPGGIGLANDARKNIRPLMEAGKNDEARAAMADLSFKLRSGATVANAAFTEGNKKDIDKAQKVVDGLNARKTEMQQKQTETTDEGIGKRLKRDIADVDETVKEATDSLNKLKEEWTQPVTEPFTESMKEQLQTFIDDTQKTSEVFAKVLEGFGGTGFANLDAKLKLGAALLNTDLMRQSKEATDKEVERQNAADEEKIAGLKNSKNSFISLRGPNAKRDTGIDSQIDQVQRGIDARTTAANQVGTAYQDLLNGDPWRERQVEMERQAALIKTSYDDSKHRTESGMSRYDIGLNEGEKLSNRTRGAMNELATDIANPSLGSGNATQSAAELAALSERLSQSKQGLVSMEDRMNRALADRVNLEGQIAEANRKQTEEGSKRLAMASREDQLRAAMASASLRRRGTDHFDMRETQFFSSETRGAIHNFMPRSVKGLDNTERDQNEERRKLDQEVAGLAVSIRTLRERFKELEPEAEGRGGKIINSRNLTGRTPTAGDALNVDQNQVRVNLNLGAVNIDIDFTKHISEIKKTLQTSFDSKLDGALKALRSDLAGKRDPNTAAAANAGG